jgi:uncharacterized phage infection (PIP) family protein YhgE
MKRLLVSAGLLALLVAVAGSASAGTPNPLKRQLRLEKTKVAKLSRLNATNSTLIASLKKKLTADGDTIDKLNKQLGTDPSTSTTAPSDPSATDAETIAALKAQVATLTAQVAAQSQAGLAAVLAGNPDDLWNAVVAIYAKFPSMTADQLCGYDKLKDGNSTGAPPNDTNYTFTLWANCPAP